MSKNIILLSFALILLGFVSCEKSPQSNPAPETKEVVRGEEFRSIDPKEIPGNPIQLIGKEWMLISAGNQEKYNTMTASWGNLGELWSRPVATCYVRPSRHTFKFMEENEYYTLCFFDEEYREALQFCGTASGRDYPEQNKAEVAGLTPLFTQNGTVYFKEAYLVLECKKLYADMIEKELFTTEVVSGDKTTYNSQDDLHKFYIGEIVNCWMR